MSYDDGQKKRKSKMSLPITKFFNIHKNNSIKVKTPAPVLNTIKSTVRHSHLEETSQEFKKCQVSPQIEGDKGSLYSLKNTPFNDSCNDKENVENQVEELVVVVDKKTRKVSHEKEEETEIHSPEIMNIKKQRLTSTPVIFATSLAKRELEFIIPPKLKALEQCFHALECTVTFMNGRDQQVIFHKIQKAVENITNKAFEVKHLKQILFLCPGMYIVEPIDILHYGKRQKSLSIRLPKSSAAHLTKTQKTSTHGSKMISACDDASVFSHAIASTEKLFDRKKRFSESCLNFVKKNYHEFIKKFDLERYEKIMHPEFNVQEIPDVPEAFLLGFDLQFEPTPTVSVKEVPIAETSATQESTVVPVEQDTKKSKALSLLERIREKEKKKLETDSKRFDKSFIKKKAMLQRLPELAQCVKLLFSQSNKNTMQYYPVIKHVSSSMQRNPISMDEAPSHINLLIEVVPNFLTLEKTDVGTIVKLSSIKYDQIESRIKEYLKDLENK